jgi:hypothetical protein
MERSPHDIMALVSSAISIGGGDDFYVLCKEPEYRSHSGVGLL